MLVPHVLGGTESPESDIAVCNRISEELGGKCHGRLHVLRGNLNHHQIKWVIGRCDFFLGARMHACIGAISQAVPALGLAYSRKFAGVFGSLGAADLVVDLTRQRPAEVLAQVKQQFERRGELKERLEAVAPGVRESVLNLFQEPVNVAAERVRAT